MGNIICPEKVEEIDLNDQVIDNYNHLSVKIPTSRNDLVNEFIKNGFYLVDTLVRFRLNINNYKFIDNNSNILIRRSKLSDLPHLEKIAEISFEIDRFHSDQNLPNPACDNYYKHWIRNSCNGREDIVIVAEYNGSIAGFTTGVSYDNYAVVGLSAVDRKYRNIGVYSKLICEEIEWAKSIGKKELIIGTQINNIIVQKVWIKLGFTILDSSYVLHKNLG